MNITGNASGWITKEKKSNVINDVVIERKSINVVKELKTLKDVYEKMDVKHKEIPNKELHDALVDIYSAIRTLENIKN
jgi:hypothetical protein